MIHFYRILSESPNIRKISLMFEETDLPHEIKTVDVHADGGLDPEFGQVNPSGMVPAIVDLDTGVSLFESGAILFYLAEKTGKLLPKETKARSEVMKWLIFEAANICPNLIEIHHYLLNDEGDTPNAIFERYKNNLVQYCSVLDQQLQHREFIAGDYSIADIAIYPWTVTLEDLAEISLDDYPHLNRWAKMLDQRIVSRANEYVLV